MKTRSVQGKGGRLGAGRVLALLAAGAVAVALSPAMAEGRSAPPPSTTSSSTTTSTTSSTSTTTSPPSRPTTTTTGAPGRTTTTSTTCPDASGPSAQAGATTTTVVASNGDRKEAKSGCQSGTQRQASTDATGGAPGATPPGAAAPAAASPAASATRLRPRPGVRARGTAPRRGPSLRAFSGPLVRALHRSAPGQALASVGAGPLGPTFTGPVPLNQDEEYVGASPGLLVPLILAAAVAIFGSAFFWERKKDRRVAEARRTLGSRIDQRRHRPSESTP